jgi:hypothetical protein
MQNGGLRMEIKSKIVKVEAIQACKDITNRTFVEDPTCNGSKSIYAHKEQTLMRPLENTQSTK